MIPYIPPALVSSYASFSSPLYGRVFYTSVKVTNPKNNKSVTITMLADTGAQNSQIDGETYGPPLGVTVTSGEPSSSSTTAGTVASYKHLMNLEIPGLKPFLNAPVYFTVKRPNPYFNNLGWAGALEKLQLNVTPNKLTYSELAQSAMANAQAYFRSRV